MEKETIKTNNQKESTALRFAIHTLGCRVNTYESDAIAQSLRAAGFLECDFSEPADIYIVNTCTVTNVADKKSRQMLHRAKKLNPSALIVAAGCYVDAALQNKEMQQLLKDAAIDLLVPNKEKPHIAQLITERIQQSGAKPAALRAAAACEACAEGAEKKPEAPGQLFMTELDGHTRAFVKVQDGCNQFCSYCIIPYVRGRISSRPIEDCVDEIRRLAENGVKEVVLTGIHLSSYGKDWTKGTADGGDAENTGHTPHPSDDIMSTEHMPHPSDDIMNTEHAPLLQLLSAVHAIPGIERIRMGSLEPRLMSEAFVSRLSRMPKVCPHFHLSLQSGCAETLRRMNRHYTPSEYRESCERLRKYYGDPAITTDVIVGFPGETDEMFEESRRFIEEIGFYELHVFKYSRRAGTRADRMEGQVSEAVKDARSHTLLELADRMSHAYREHFLGKEVCMLCEEAVSVSGEPFAAGYSREYVRCLKPCGADGFTGNTVVSGTVSKISREKEVYETLILR